MKKSNNEMEHIPFFEPDLRWSRKEKFVVGFVIALFFLGLLLTHIGIMNWLDVQMESVKTIL